MPRTRPHLDRDQKVAELVEAAERRLLEGGYANLSVADIARELGLAQNAVYWYFPSRDHLFVAALERIIQTVMAGKPPARTPVEYVLWFTERIYEFRALRAAVHERARTSPVVADFEASFIARVKALLLVGIAASVEESRLDVTADAVLALIEGVLLRDLSRRRRAEVVRFGFERLTDCPTPTSRRPLAPA